MTNKYLYWMMAASAAAAMTLGLASCGDDGKDEEPGPGELKLTLTAGDVTDTSIKFTITPENAEKVYYTVIKDGEAVPDAAAILAEGTKGTLKEKTYTVSNLEPETAYIVAAVASSGDKTTAVEQVKMTTSAKIVVPIVELTAGAPNKTKLTFTLKATDAQKAAYVCVKKGETVPDAAGILSSGTAVEVSAEGVEVTVEGLTAATEYVIAAAASYGETLSVVKQISMTTLDAEAVELTSLFGTWNAKMKAYGINGNQVDFTKTVDVTFDVVISDGVNDWTRNLYGKHNVVVCQGMMGFGPYDVSDWTSNGYTEEEANMYWGPKWFLKLENGKVIVPSQVNLCEEEQNDSMSAGALPTTNGEQVVFIVPVGDQVLGAENFPVEVAADNNTFTVKPVQGNNYPSLCSPGQEGWGPWILPSKTGASFGASEMVLTRKSNSVAPLALPAPALGHGDIKTVPASALRSSAVSTTLIR